MKDYLTGEKVFNLKKLLPVVLLLVGILVTVYLVQRSQILKSRATSELNSALSVTDSEGNELEYQGNNTFKTNSTNIRVGIKDLEQLK